MIAIVVPTYNEKDNIVRLLEILNKLYGSNPNLRVLIVDDSSPDGTKDVVLGYLKKSRPNLQIDVLSKPQKTGLRDAYFFGFKYLFKNDARLKGVIQMDADLSHKPEYAKKHISNLDSGIDLSIGSRYVHGGGVKDWSLFRLILSRGGNLLNRLVLSPRIHDYTGGYNALSKEALIYVLKAGIVTSSGYYFQTELKYRILQTGRFSVKEFPIIFVDRTAGESKMGANIILESIKQLINIRRRKVTR